MQSLGGVQVYEAISPHFSSTRFAVWPRWVPCRPVHLSGAGLHTLPATK